MIRESYMEFVRLFGEMNPFELSHLSEALFNKFEHLIIEEKQCKCDLPFAQQDVEYVLTRAMRDIHLELAHTMMDDAKMQLERAKSLTFTPKKVTKEDEARAAGLSTKVTDLPGEGRKKQTA